MKLIICLGHICSGKTSWSKNFVLCNPSYYRFCLDELRMSINDKITPEEPLEESLKIFSRMLTGKCSVNNRDMIIDGYYHDISSLSSLIHTAKNAEIRIFNLRSPYSAMLRARRKEKEFNLKLQPVDILKNYRECNQFFNSPEFKALAYLNNTKIREMKYYKAPELIM